MAPEVLGIAGSVHVSERAASTAALSFSGVEMSGTGPPSFTTTPTPTRASATRLLGTKSPALPCVSIAGTERMMASNAFSASSLSMLNGGRIVKITLWPLLEFSGDGLGRDRVDPTLSTRTSAAVARVDEAMSVSALTAIVQKDRAWCPQGTILWSLSREFTPKRRPPPHRRYCKCSADHHFENKAHVAFPLLPPAGANAARP